MRFGQICILFAGLGLTACGGDAPQAAGLRASAASTVFEAEPVAYSIVRQESEFGDMADILMAEVNGADAKIQAFEYAFVEVVIAQDLNGDGTSDAIISVNGGGNCCPSDYYFIAHRGGTDFTVRQIPEIYSWEGPELIEAEDGVTVRFVSINEGMHTGDYKETTHIFRFDGDMPVIVSDVLRAELPALAELRSSAFETNPSGRRSFRHDLDGDGRADEISCGFWDRWGRLTDCHAAMATRDEIVAIEASCRRLGVLGQATNRFNDLVCDADQVVRYDAIAGTYLTE